MQQVLLSLGSNMGNRPQNLETARRHIERLAGRLCACSSIYETEPWGFEAHDLFYNQVVAIETHLTPHDLMDVLLRIECSLGRIRTGTGYSSRPIDIDILYYGQQIIQDEQLTVPHPRIAERRFILAPLCEVAPAFTDPCTGLTISRMFDICKDSCKVWSIAEPLVDPGKKK